MESVGNVGMTARDRAFVAHLDLAGKVSSNTMINGIIAYGALISNAHRDGVSPSPPNRVSWAHLGDLDDLRSRLASDLGVTE